MNSDTALRKTRNCSPYGEEDLERLRALLEEHRDAVARRFEELSEAARRALSESLGELSSLPQHLGDLASDTTEHSMALDFLARAEQEAEEIDDALERIDHRSYGLCIQCGEAIPMVRLVAIPTARLCLGCKLESER